MIVSAINFRKQLKVTLRHYNLNNKNILYLGLHYWIVLQFPKIYVIWLQVKNRADDKRTSCIDTADDDTRPSNSKKLNGHRPRVQFFGQSYFKELEKYKAKDQ